MSNVFGPTPLDLPRKYTTEAVNVQCKHKKKDEYIKTVVYNNIIGAYMKY